MFGCKVRTRNCAGNSWLAPASECASDDWRHMRPTPAELEVARALIARVKATDPSIKRVDELLMCAAVACRADELGGDRLSMRSGDGQEHLEAEAGDRLGRSAWEARASACSGVRQRLARAASLDREECARRLRHQYATNSLVRKIPACLCQVHRLLYSRQTEAGVARTLISRLKAAEFLALRGGC